MKGRPVRGAISGFFSGLFIAIDLMFLGAIHTDSPLITVLPLVGLVLGLALGWWAPVGRARASTVPPAAPDLSSFVTRPSDAPAPPRGDPISSPPDAPATMAHIADDGTESAPTSEETPNEGS
jgi:hypothetical protein